MNTQDYWKRQEWAIENANYETNKKILELLESNEVFKHDNQEIIKLLNNILWKNYTTD